MRCTLYSWSLIGCTYQQSTIRCTSHVQTVVRSIYPVVVFLINRLNNINHFNVAWLSKMFNWPLANRRCTVSKVSQIIAQLLGEKRPLCVLSPLGDLGYRGTYAVHLRLIGKPVVDFLFVLIELFFSRCYVWGATSEYRLEIGVFERGGSL